MTEGKEKSVPAGSLGSIKDLLRKANGMSTEPMPWHKEGRGRAGDGSPPDKDTTDLTAKQPEEKEDTTAVETTGKAAQAQPPAVVPQTPRKEEKSGRQEGKLHESEAKTKAKGKAWGTPKPAPEMIKPLTRTKGSYKEFEKHVNAFDLQQESGRRHMVFIPEEVFNALQLTYGERKISAVYAVLARTHIATFKDDMRQSIAGKSSLLAE